MHSETVWEFDTENFRVSLEIEPDFDLDLSWDEDGEVAEKIDSGEYVAFMASVVVYMRGHEIARDVLGGCVYESVEEFATSHRDSDPMNRNCSIMRAKRGENVCICHYFPGMVSEAIREARKYLSTAPSIRNVA